MLVVIIGDFNVDVAKPDKKDCFLVFIRVNFGLACHNGRNQPTTRYRSGLDLVLIKNVAEVVTEPISVYPSDYEVFVTAIGVRTGEAGGGRPAP